MDSSRDRVSELYARASQLRSDIEKAANAMRPKKRKALEFEIEELLEQAHHLEKAMARDAENAVHMSSAIIHDPAASSSASIAKSSYGGCASTSRGRSDAAMMPSRMRDVMRATLVATLRGKQEAPVYVDVDRCPTCDVDFVMRAETMLMVCPECHEAVDRTENPNENMGSLYTPTHTMPKTGSKKRRATHSPQYTTYISQWAAALEPVNKNVRRALLLAIYKRGAVAAVCGKASWVDKALVGKNMSRDKEASVRIWAEVRGFPLPNLSSEDLAELERRYAQVHTIFKLAHPNSKSMPFAAITQISLEAMGRIAQARALPFEKKRDTVLRTREQIYAVLVEVAQKHPGTPWRFCVYE